MSAPEPSSSSSLASTSTDATEVPPKTTHHKTLNAQNVKQDVEQLPAEADPGVPHARSPEHDQLGVGGGGASVATPMSETIPMRTALEEGPAPAATATATEGEGEGEEPKRLDKGKGKEVLGAAALGTAGVGAGVGMKELLAGDKVRARIASVSRAAETAR